MAKRTAPKQAAKTLENLRLCDLLDPIEIDEQLAYQRRMITEALGDQARTVRTGAKKKR